MRRQPWALAIIYVVVSLVVEAALMVVGRLKVPQDNAILAPVVLTIPPLLVAWVCGYRRPKELVAVAALLSVLTLVFTVVFGRLTGVSTGLVEPIIVRTLAGFLAGTIARRLTLQAQSTPAKKTTLLLLLSLAGAVILVAVVSRIAAAKPTRTIAPPDESEVELTATEKGVTYKLYRAALWRVDARSGRWEFIQQMYDPDFYAKNYVERDGVICRKAGNGSPVPVRRQFADGFEHAKPVRELIGMETGWTAFTLQSPKTPSVNDYVRLRKRILQGQSDFVDNRVELTADIVHSGQRALKTYSVPPSRSMVCAKASLDTELLHFVKGDDMWFSGWYHVPAGGGMPFTVMDLETTWIKEYPGIRIMLADGKHAMFELKWGAKPKYRQPKGKEVVFPIAKWVHLQAHLKLSEKEDGIAELWQDGVKIVDARGQTLPLAHTIYNSLEIGISAYNDPDKPATLYVDDVSIADKPANGICRGGMAAGWVGRSFRSPPQRAMAGCPSPRDPCDGHWRVCWFSGLPAR